MKVPYHLEINCYVNFLGRRLGSNGFQLININVWHPWQLKKSKSWGPFWSYQLNSLANSAHLAYFPGKWAGLAVLSSREPQNDPHDFDIRVDLA
jgi:hypothetical protein